MKMKDGDLNYNNYEKKNKKASKIILTLIVLMFIAIIAVICTILYIQQTTLKAYINQNKVNISEKVISIDENTNKIYFNIKEIAKYLGYEAHNGEYKIYSEDTNKCWVYCKNETASFYLNSNKISKVAPNTNKDYEDYTVSDPVISKNGELYASAEAIQIGFNSIVNYNANTHTLKIETLPYLVSYYDKILKRYGYEGVDSKFYNQKAILYNLFVVKKENNLYGVIDSSNKEIIGSRYKNIEFNESSKEFYVSDNTNKFGIVTDTGENKTDILYDSITLADKQNGLYVVTNNKKYGVLDRQGKIVIHLEYDAIGIDTKRFPTDTIKNKYVLYDNLIPVYQNKKWGVFDITGQLIIPIEFDYLGYTKGKSVLSPDRTVNNLLLIPSFKGLVLGQIKQTQTGNQTTSVSKYAVYDKTGKELIACALDSAYSLVNAGITTYYMEYQGQTLDIEKYVQRVYGNTDEVQE